MKIVHLLSTILMSSAFGMSSFGQCADSSNVYSFSYNGSNYELVLENITWQGAAACAQMRGGYLAEIDDSTENVAIFNELTNNAGITNGNTTAPDGGGGAYVWIGGNDLATEGMWIWDGDNTGASVQFWQGTASGNPVGGLFNNWGNEPDDFNGQDALGISLNGWPLGFAGEWNDVDETNQLHFLIEYPSTAGMNELNNEFHLYPNPMEDVIHVLSDQGISEVIIRSTHGQSVTVLQSNGENELEINVSDLAGHLFFIELTFENGATSVRKLIK